MAEKKPAFKRKAAITLPLLKHTAGNTVFITPECEIYTGKKVEDNKEPANLIKCVNLETGEQCEYIVSAVLKGIFEENMKGEYVGKKLEIIKHPKENGKPYNAFSVYELE